MVFDKSVHLQRTGTFTKWLFPTDRVSSERLGDFRHALQALRFSDSLKLMYRGVLSVEDRPWWCGMCSLRRIPGQVLGISSCRLFSKLSAVFLSQVAFWVFQTKVERIRGSSASADARKRQLTREIARRRAFERTASKASTLGLGSHLPPSLVPEQDLTLLRQPPVPLLRRNKPG